MRHSSSLVKYSVDKPLEIAEAGFCTGQVSLLILYQQYRKYRSVEVLHVTSPYICADSNV